MMSAMLSDYAEAIRGGTSNNVRNSACLKRAAAVGVVSKSIGSLFATG